LWILIELFGIILLAPNFLDGFCKLSKLDWYAAYQIVALLLCLVDSAGPVDPRFPRRVAGG
jgi:hypothetical protein